MRISDWSSDVCSSDLLGRNQPLYARVLALGGGVGLQFAQTLVTAGANHRDAMLFLSRQRDPFKVADIPGISADEQTELARKLLVDGFLDRKSTSLNSSHQCASRMPSSARKQ